MCYNVYIMRSEIDGEVDVGVRELRQNLSLYLERVEAGTVFRVTDRGRAVALLVPLRAGATIVDRLVASGRASRTNGDLLALGRPTLSAGKSLTEALRQVREDPL